jgi:hypothetical protein
MFGLRKGNQFPYLSHVVGKLKFMSGFLSCVWQTKESIQERPFDFSSCAWLVQERKVKIY